MVTTILSVEQYLVLDIDRQGRITVEVTELDALTIAQRNEQMTADAIRLGLDQDALS